MGPRVFSSSELGSKFSEGARLLWLALLRSDTSQEGLRSAVGCTKGVVGRWLKGERRPDELRRRAIFKRFGVPPSLWDVPPRKSFSIPKSSAHAA